jgi:hypothetical protein
MFAFEIEISFQENPFSSLCDLGFISHEKLFELLSMQNRLSPDEANEIEYEMRLKLNGEPLPEIVSGDAIANSEKVSKEPVNFYKFHESMLILPAEDYSDNVCRFGLHQFKINSMMLFLW